MTTLAALNTLVATDLRDTGYATFPSATVDNLVNLGLVEVGRLAPERFQEDITPRTNVLSYPLRCLLAPTAVASTDLFSTTTAHGLDSGTAVVFRSLTGGAGLTVGTTYYVIASGLTSTAFKVSTTSGGSALDVTTDLTASVMERQDTLPEVEVRRVEVWDNSVTPAAWVATLDSVGHGRVNVSAAGWDLWNGTLSLSNSQYANLDLTKNYLRVWGYAPYRPLSSYVAQTLSPEQQSAIRAYARLEALRTLAADRTLFTQWQTASHNTDVTIAALMNYLNTAQAEWRQRSRALTVLREVS